LAQASAEATWTKQCQVKRQTNRKRAVGFCASMVVHVFIAVVTVTLGNLIVGSEGLADFARPTDKKITYYARFESPCAQEKCSEALVVVHSCGAPGAEAAGIEWLLNAKVRNKFHIYVYTDAPAQSMRQEFQPSSPGELVPNVADEFSKYLHFLSREYDRLPEKVRFMHSHQFDGHGD